MIFDCNYAIIYNVVEQTIMDYLFNAKDVAIYKDSTPHTLNLKEKEELFNALRLSLKDSYEMPAFSVSLDEETKTELKSGIWIEFKYPSKMTHNDLSFDSLFIKLQKDAYGLNLIRKNNDSYFGRCFHINLAQPFNKIYDFAVSVFKE